VILILKSKDFDFTLNYKIELFLVVGKVNKTEDYVKKAKI